MACSTNDLYIIRMGSLFGKDKKKEGPPPAVTKSKAQ